MILPGWVARFIGRFATEPLKPKVMIQLNPTDLLVDVSHHNGVIDWKKVKEAGVMGAILKATEGATGVDKKLAANMSGCKANGIPWGAYHFATWNNENEALDAKQEADHFINRVKAFGTPELPMVLDIESNNPIPYTKQEMVDFVQVFLGTVKAAGYEVAIYGSPGFLNSYLPTNHPFTDVPLWIADYTGAINPVPGWKKVWLHQYTDKGTLKGIAGAVDLNRVL